MLLLYSLSCCCYLKIAMGRPAMALAGNFVSKRVLAVKLIDSALIAASVAGCCCLSNNNVVVVDFVICDVLRCC